MTKLFPVPGPPCNVHTRGCISEGLGPPVLPSAELANSCANARSATFSTTLRCLSFRPLFARPDLHSRTLGAVALFAVATCGA
eukprot:2431364-Pyramimonas_sp.AAC.1